MFGDGTAALWLGVVAIGAYHGLNPSMGWPLAVARGLTERRAGAVFETFVPLGVGHLLAIALVLVPFGLLSWLYAWSREIRMGAGVLVMGFGVVLLVQRRHPRWTTRVRPTQLLLWSLLIATAHGAALMLLPFLIGLCAAPAPPGDAPGAFTHAGAMALMRSGVATAVAVALLHSAAMVAAGSVAAWLVYRHLGLRALRASWLNLDVVWALSLIVAGGAAVAMALAVRPDAVG